MALNEALYLRREPPMREPPGTLALLLDSGIRMWGVPRVFAAAVSLALIAKETRKADIRSLRGMNGKLTPVDLLSRKGLIEHLSALEVEAHPGAVLEPFGNSLPAGEHQSVLITHIDTLDDEDFRRTLGATKFPPRFIAAVDGAGNFELHEVPLNRCHPVCQAQLNIESFFKTASLPAKILKRSIPSDLPAIFGIQPFPFLLPMPGRIDCWKRGEDDYIYALMRDRRLVKYRDSTKGTQSLAWDLPGGKTIWLDHANGKVFAVKSGDGQRPARLVCVDAEGGPARVHELGGGPEILAVHRYGEVILAIRSHDARAFSLADGRLLDQARNPHRWMNGRFLRGQNYHYFAAWDGEGIKFQYVTFPATLTPTVICVFDRDGTNGPWCLLSNGTVASLTTSEVLIIPALQPKLLHLVTARISRDGHRMLFSRTDQPGYCLIDLQKDPDKAPAVSSSSEELEPNPPRPWRNLYRVVQAIAVAGKTLVIQGRSGNWLEFISNPEIILRQHAKAEGHVRLKTEFTYPAKKTEYGCTLQIAQWKSGSKAFLDSRGLLHLKSSDASIPEVTLALDGQGAAGWTSDGHVCGPSYYFAENVVSEPGAVLERVERFIAAL